MRLTILSALLVSAVLGGCSKSASVPDDGPLLDGLHFADPLTVAVNLGKIANANGQALDTPDAHVAAIMLQAGSLKAVPDSSHAPWYGIQVSRGSVANQTATLQYGKRVITGRSDPKSWTEGAVDLYAETISYEVVFDPPVEQAATQQSGGPLALSFQLRLIARNDPAVGHWVASFGTDGSEMLPPADLQRAVAGLSHAGDPRVAGSQITIARMTAFDEIEEQLAGSGTLARASNPDILLSPLAHLAIWKNATDLKATTLGGAESYCQSLSAPGYASWRLPTAAEIRRFISGGIVSGNGDVIAEGHLVDTPDGRLWGATGAPIFSNPVNLVLRTLDGTVNHEQWDLSDPAPPEAMPHVGVMMVSIFSNGEAGLGPVDFNLNPFQSPDFYSHLNFGNILLGGDFRLICVSTLAPK